jgi:mutator protein MutT
LTRKKWSASVSFTKALGDEGGDEERGLKHERGDMKNSRGDSATPQASSFRSRSAIDVAAGLIFRGSKLLITQRRSEVDFGGLWEFPGGKREAGESFEDCLRRELWEELGIEVEVGELLDSTIHAYPEKTVHLKFYRCELLREEPQTLGCNAIAWVGCDELERFKFPAADEKLLHELRTSPELWPDRVKACRKILRPPV